MRIHNRSKLMSKILKLQKKFQKLLKKYNSIPWERWNRNKPDFVEEDPKLIKIGQSMAKRYTKINSKKNVFCFTIMSRL